MKMMTKFIAICSLVLFYSVAIYGQNKSGEETPPIIDVHVHAFPATWSTDHTPFNVTTGQPSTATRGTDLLPLTLAEFEKQNIQVSVLSGPLESVAKWKAAAPDRFLGGPQFPMAYLKTDTSMLLQPYWESVKTLREAHENQEIAVIGEITAQYGGLEPSTAILEPYFALAEELDIPVGVHTGTGPPGAIELEYPSHRVNIGNPILLEDVLSRHPGLRLYLMHAGYPYLQDTIAIMHAYPRVYAGLGAINWRLPRAAFHQYLQDLITAGFEKRIMFGSDSEAWPEGISLAVEGVNQRIF